MELRRLVLRLDTESPTWAWTTQAGRNLGMGYDKAISFVIGDGAGQCTRSFHDVFAAIGRSVITVSPGAPQANAFAERWIRTVRHELVDRTLIWNQRRLRQLFDELL